MGFMSFAKLKCLKRKLRPSSATAACWWVCLSISFSACLHSVMSR
jgi:hypothetical protein